MQRDLNVFFPPYYKIFTTQRIKSTKQIQKLICHLCKNGSTLAEWEYKNLSLCSLSLENKKHEVVLKHNDKIVVLEIFCENGPKIIIDEPSSSNSYSNGRFSGTDHVRGVVGSAC